MALTLRTAITATQTTFDVLGADDLQPGDFKTIDDETIVIRTAKAETLGYGESARYRVSVYRGTGGTRAAAHDAAAELATYSGEGGGGVTVNDVPVTGIVAEGATIDGAVATLAEGGAAPLVTKVITTFVCPPGEDFVVPFETLLQNEVQGVYGGGVIGGGTWDITGVMIAPTADIPWDVDAAGLQALVDASATTVTVTGGPLASAEFYFEYIGSNAGIDIDELTVDGTNLTGTGPTITPETIDEGGTPEGSATSVTYSRADWDNEDALLIPAPGMAWISARVDQTVGPYTPIENMYLEIVTDSADRNAGNVFGRNFPEGDGVAILDNGPYFAAGSAQVVQESGSVTVSIHVQHDAAGSLTLSCEALVIFLPATAP